jgi:hypothetical protein
MMIEKCISLQFSKGPETMRSGVVKPGFSLSTLSREGGQHAKTSNTPNVKPHQKSIIRA